MYFLGNHLEKKRGEGQYSVSTIFLALMSACLCFRLCLNFRVEIAGLIVNLRGFNSRYFGHQDKKPFKDFGAFFRMAGYLVQQGKVEAGMRVNGFQIQGLFTGFPLSRE